LKTVVFPTLGNPIMPQQSPIDSAVISDGGRVMSKKLPPDHTHH
jgi:hypothetical protein